MPTARSNFWPFGRKKKTASKSRPSRRASPSTRGTIPFSDLESGHYFTWATPQDARGEKKGRLLKLGPEIYATRGKGSKKVLEDEDWLSPESTAKMVKRASGSRTVPTGESRKVGTSPNPHRFSDAKIRVRGSRVDIMVPNPTPSSAAAFLKVMGRRKNGAASALNPWDREQFIRKARDLEYSGYVRLGLNYTKLEAQKMVKAQRAKGNNAKLMPYPAKGGGTKYGVWVRY